MASTIAAGTTSGTAIAIAGDTSGVLQLQTNGTTAAVTINTSQNVGIGTSSPASKLDVNGQITATAATINNAGASTVLTIGGDTASTVPEIRFKMNSATRYNFQIGIGTQVNDAFTITPSTAIGGTTFTTPTLTADSSGNVLVGTTTSYAKTTSASNVGDGYVYASVSISNQANHMVFKNDATTVGSISRNGGSAVSYNTSSDYRLKENIEPMAGALTVVSLLKPVTYKWKIDGTNGQGFIAHELAEVVPDCVAGEKDAVDADGNIKPQGIDTSFLVATLTAAIQELNAKVDAQAVRIAELEGAK